ncbi:MAG TPA: hypothetical protein VN249_02460 [Prolixibacteraceae bacterium]|nr:hypothetical protein [Prolixibacteraceae bacterium]
MRSNFLKSIIILVVLALFPGISFAQDINGKKNSEVTETASDSLKTRTPEKISIQTPKKDESIYRIDIKEERIPNTFFSRKVSSIFTNRNFRAALISWNIYLPGPLDRYYISIIDKAFRFPAVLLFLFIIVTLALNVLLVTGILFLTNRVMNYRKVRENRQRMYFEQVLTDLMLQGIEMDDAISLLSKPELKKKYNLLIEVMMDFQKSFRGDSDRYIIELYQKMDLAHISYNKTFDISFYKQVKGIRELANMHPDFAIEMIALRLNDPNDIVRMEAQICYPYVNSQSPFDFLDLLEKPFSKWAQLNIYYFIKIHELPVPSFNRWLSSGNVNVVNFCILMSELFQQQENAAELIQKLNYPNENTRSLAISACGNLHLFESKTVMKNNFRTETQKNQVQIIKSLNNMGDETDIPFLEEIIRSNVIILQLEACRVLYNLSDKGRAHLERLNHSLNDKLSVYIAHVKDTRN